MIGNKSEKSAKFCPKCGCDSLVVNSRYRNGVILRRRECQSCGARWSTREVMIIRGN